ncbi:MAG TPA: Gfo/Idh/MocA family oxidoreductase [Phycisphaerae bacterium]|nr:Gfo/Idh/MocA family oxidoreductase [Phycisphaerae bacterium]
MAKLKAAVIGAGAIAHHCHLPGYQGHPDCQLVALADIDPSRAAQAAERFGVLKTYQDYRQMIEREELDMVSVCTPNYLHREMAEAVARRGIHVLLEKPVALSVPDAVAIRQAVRAARVQCMVGFTHRFYHGNQQARQLIADGAIGEPFMMRVRFAHKGPQPGWAMSDWFYRRAKSGGGALLDMGIHAMDICRYMIGPVGSVSALIGTLRKDIEVDDNAVLSLDFAPKRAFGYVEVGWTSCPGFTGLEIYGDNGTIIVDYARPVELILGSVRPDGVDRTQRQHLPPPPGPQGWPRQMASFIDCISDGRDVPVGIDDGIAATAVAEAAARSAELGQSIEVDAT